MYTYFSGLVLFRGVDGFEWASRKSPESKFSSMSITSIVLILLVCTFRFLKWDPFCTAISDPLSIILFFRFESYRRLNWGSSSHFVGSKWSSWALRLDLSWLRIWLSTSRCFIILWVSLSTGFRFAWFTSKIESLSLFTIFSFKAEEVYMWLQMRPYSWCSFFGAEDWAVPRSLVAVAFEFLDQQRRLPIDLRYSRVSMWVYLGRRQVYFSV